MTNDSEQLETLLAKLLDGNLSAAEQAGLEELLWQSAEARRAYFEVMLTHAALMSEFDQQIPAELAPLVEQASASGGQGRPRSPILGFLGELPATFQPARHPLRFFSLAAAATSIFWIVILVFLWRPVEPPGRAKWGPVFAHEPITARLLYAEQAQWRPGSIAYRVGDRLSPQQRMELQAGIVRLSFGSGAQVAIEGPASVTIDSAQRMSLESGRVLTQVPPAAQGFAVVTPQVEIIDLGTEFGLETQGEESEVQVFSGRVSAKCLHDEQAPLHVIAPGKTVVLGNSLTQGSYVKEKPMNRTTYLSLATVLALVATQRAEAIPLTIYSHPDDAIVANVVVAGSGGTPAVGTKLLENTAAPLIMGNYGSLPARNGNGILFFQLPSNVQSIDSATLTVRVDLFNPGASASTKNVDAWGLGYQSGTTIDINNWFNTLNTDAGAGVGIASRVKIQDNLIAGSSHTDSTLAIATPLVRSTSGTALRDYLQSLYDAGAQGGDYAIIRLNLDYDPGTTLSRYRILSGDSSDLALRPVLQLEYTEMPIPAPEPSTGMILPGALLLWGWKRRMKGKNADRQ